MNDEVEPVSYHKIYSLEFLTRTLKRSGCETTVDLALKIARTNLTREDNERLAYSVVSTQGEDMLVYLSSTPITPQQVEENMNALNTIGDDLRKIKILQAQYDVNFNAARAMRRDKLKIQELQLELKQLKDRYAIQEP